MLFNFISLPSRFVERSAMSLLARLVYLALKYQKISIFEHSLLTAFQTHLLSKEENSLQALTSLLLFLSETNEGIWFIYQHNLV